MSFVWDEHLSHVTTKEFPKVMEQPLNPNKHFLLAQGHDKNLNNTSTFPCMNLDIKEYPSVYTVF